METLLYHGNFLTVYLLENQSVLTLKNVWHENSKEMTDTDFKYEIELWCELVEKHQPKANLVDTLQFNFTVSLETQTWYNESITPRKFEAGMRKMAFLIPKELLSELSIEQIFDDQQAILFHYFDDETQALNWLDS